MAEEMCLAPDGTPKWGSGVTGNRWFLLYIFLIGATPITILLLGPRIVFALGKAVGYYLKKKTAGRRSQILETVEADEKEFLENRETQDNDDWESVDAYAAGTVKNGEPAQKEFDGIIGFFHPFCNAGGGGERVLWAAIRATQKRWPSAKIVVYTGDNEVDKTAMLARVKERFNINLHAPTVNFLYLSKRAWVLSSSWPHFTLLGQSVGSLILAWDAFSLLVPDIFVDTMGYTFALALSKIVLRDVPTGAYIHYPTISNDMLESLDPDSPLGDKGVNAGQGSGIAGDFKRLYWYIFSCFYTWAGASVDIVMTNSNWTLQHIAGMWGQWRIELQRQPAVAIFPPVAVEELEREVEVSEISEKKRENIILYIAQFRPEKDHQLILKSFAEFKATETFAARSAKLVLVGSVRDDGDSKRVYELRLLANELQIKDSVEFHLDASWPEILDWLSRASVGVNGMWNEHFGIGVVEYEAAGLISVVHASGGPKQDIVVPIDGEATGYLATTSTEFAEGFELALGMEDKLSMRLRARKSAKRFTEEEFAKKWVYQMDLLIRLRNYMARKQ